MIFGLDEIDLIWECAGHKKPKANSIPKILLTIDKFIFTRFKYYQILI
jgi:hypothetical protein